MACKRRASEGSGAAPGAKFTTSPLPARVGSNRAPDVLNPMVSLNLAPCASWKADEMLSVTVEQSASHATPSA